MLYLGQDMSGFQVKSGQFRLGQIMSGYVGYQFRSGYVWLVQFMSGSDCVRLGQLRTG
jgi:hypothetical protein